MPPIQPQHNTTKTTMFTLAMAFVAVCGFGGNSAKAGDLENIQGTWTLETMSLNGKVMPRVSIVYVFKGETLIVGAGTGKDDKVATFTLDVTAKPNVMIVQRAEHLPDAKPERTPYELDGDTLRMVIASHGDRPTEISDKGHLLFTLKRGKP